MKKIFALIGIMLISFFPAYALDSDSPQTDSLSLRKSQNLSNPLNFEFTPCNITMNSLGDVGVSYTTATWKGLIIFDRNGNKLSEFHFDCDGSYFIELSDEEIMIYTLRGRRCYHYSINGEFLFFENANNIITREYREAISVTEIKNADSRLILKKNIIGWKLYLNDILIMDCNPFVCFFHNIFPFLLIFGVLFGGSYIVLRQMKKENNSEELEGAQHKSQKKA